MSAQYRRDQISDRLSTCPDCPDCPEVRLSRRALLRRAAAFGAATPLIAGLLAACGGSSSSPSSSTSTTSSSSGGSTATTSTSSAASPQATSAATPTAAGTPNAQAGGIKYTIEPVKHKGGKLIAGATGDAKTLNPVIVTDGPSYTNIYMIFEGLTQTNPSDATPMGLLAKSWDISADGLTYSFVLNDGVKWHDGQPFSANDVKFTYELFLNPDSKSSFTSSLTAAIKSIDVADDTHVSFTLKQPNASFLANDTYYQIVPQHILQSVAPKDLAADSFSTGKKGRTIGTGPFMFDEWVKDDHITLVKNPNYWQGDVALDQWIYKVVPNQTVLTQQLKTGEVDYGGINPADAADMKKQSNVTVTAYNTNSFTFYGYNLDPSKSQLFQDKTVRQALLYALDRPAMIDAVYFGYAKVAVGTMPLLSWAYDPSAIKLKYPYDPNKAKSMLAADGWKAGSDGILAKNGKKLSFEIWTSSASQTYVELTTIFQQQWKKIGVDCTPKTEEWNAFLTRITGTFDFEMELVGFGWPGTDPDQSLMWPCSAYKAGFNLYKYCNPQVDKLLQDGLATTDRAKRIQIYNQMQNILMDDLPAAILFFPQSLSTVNKRVHNIFPNSLNTTFDTWQWWVDA